ncbi:MAG: hypothetical protein AAF849_09870 [Bacteroidota bacterium]
MKIELQERIDINKYSSDKSQRVIRLNQKWSNELKWSKRLIEQVIFKSSKSLDGLLFAEYVAQWQYNHGFSEKESDGIVGPNTYHRLLIIEKKYKLRQENYHINNINDEQLSSLETRGVWSLPLLYSQYHGYLDYTDKVVKHLTNKSLKARMLNRFSKLYREHYKVLSSMKGAKKISTGLKLAGNVAEFINVADIASRYNNVIRKGKGNVDAKLVIDTYLFLLSNPKYPQLALAAQGVGIIYQLTDDTADYITQIAFGRKFGINEMLDSASDIIADILFKILNEPISKSEYSYGFRPKTLHEAHKESAVRNQKVIGY